jgi:sugar phosphate permease
MNYSN